MIRRKKWDPERMKAATEVMRNKEMGSYKSSRVFSVPQTTYSATIKTGRKAQVKQNWEGSKL
jgi:hypothetical protein